MTKPEELLELADRCEREEASRELDAAVLIACGHQAILRSRVMGWEYRPNRIGIWQSMPSPTSSLDAALTLVPEGDDVFWRVGHDQHDPSGFRAQVLLASRAEPRDGFFAVADAPALALCAAALRARAAVSCKGTGAMRSERSERASHPNPRTHNE